MMDLTLDTATVPEISTLMAYKGVYVLCTRGREGRLKATHYASVLIGGSTPLWGIWLVSGRFVRFASSRHMIEEAYPRLVWRRKMATWACTDVTDKSVETRRAELEVTYGKHIAR